MKTLGLIGFGAFGQFFARHLRPHFDILANDARGLAAEARRARVKWGTLAEAAACDVVVLAVPAQKLDGVLKKIRTRLRPGALVADVCSVKVEPLRNMARWLPRGVDILGTHPLFGPDSGRKGIAGLPMVLCPVRGRRTAKAARFLKSKLKLKVFRMAPAAHDRQMACVQALTHWIGRALEHMRLPGNRRTTVAYRRLLEMRDLLKHDSNELYQAIEGMNPYAKTVRRRFLKALTALDQRL